MIDNLALKVIQGKHQDKVIRITQYGSLGSSPNATTVIDESGVQRFHALICNDPVGVCIIDEGGGVKVNDKTVTKAPIRIGDLIEIAECKLLVVNPESSDPTDEVPSLKSTTSIRKHAHIDIEVQKSAEAAKVKDAGTTESPPAPLNSEPHGEWVYQASGLEIGPVPYSVLIQLTSNGQLKRSSLVRAVGTKVWIPAESVNGLFVSSSQWLYKIAGTTVEIGPIPLNVLNQLLAAGQLSKNDFVKPSDSSSWKKASDVSELRTHNRKMTVRKLVVIAVLFLAAPTYFIGARILALIAQPNPTSKEPSIPAKFSENRARGLLDDYLKAWCFGRQESFYGAKAVVIASSQYKPESYSIGVSQQESDDEWKFKVLCKFRTRIGATKEVPMEFAVSKGSIFSLDMPE